MRIAIPTLGTRKLSNKVADTFSRAPTFTIVSLKDLEIVDVETIESPASSLEKGAGPIAARTLKNKNVDLLITGELGPGARNILEDFNITTYRAHIGKKVNETIEEWKKLGL